MFQKVDEPNFIAGEHEMLRFWQAQDVFRKLQQQNADKPHWSFLDGPITANNPMGVHHAWGRTYKDAFQRYRAMTGRKLRYQNGFDCQGLWVEVEVEKELNLGTKTGIADYGIDKFVRECKKRVLKFAARQTEQSVRLGYWMEWDDPGELRKLSEAIDSSFSGDSKRSPSHTYTTARGQIVSEPAEQIAAKLGNPEWGGSYFTFSTENNETIWSFLKKCFERKKIYQGHDVMPWSGRAGSAYSQMEVADGRKLTTHRSCFVRFRLRREDSGKPVSGEPKATPADDSQPADEYLLVWTTTPWTLTSNVACAVNPDLEYVKLRAKKDGAVYYFAKDNLEFKRLEKEFKEGFGRPEWSWPDGVGKLKSIAQLFKEQGGYDILPFFEDEPERPLLGREMIGWRYEGPFDELPAIKAPRPSDRFHAKENLPPEDLFIDSQRLDIATNLEAVVDSYFDRCKENIARRYQNLIEQEPNHVAELNARAEGRTERSELQRNQLRFALLLEATAAHRHDLYGFLEYEEGIRLPYGSVPKFGLLSAVEQHIRNIGCLDVISTNRWEQLKAVEVLAERWRVGGEDAIVGDVEADEAWAALESWKEAKGKQLRRGFFARLANEHAKILKAIRRAVIRNSGHSVAEFHRVVDGGRDSRGSATVTAGEGTGIVHIAPGCGDVDYKLGQHLDMPIVDPLLEDGTFSDTFGVIVKRDAFGPFTGRRATDPDTAQMVFDSLKEKGLLVAVETYPHIYPFCWRTGDELVFRLVDEWFINMDWREEIKEVVDTIEWLPPSIEGRDREREWLTNMRDWMISKKRFWGLALPIWVNPDDPSDFEVMGSLEELKQRALEAEKPTDGVRGIDSGWSTFEGHTPHRPWIDAVKIRSRKTGAVLSRIVDVGNPWLDAGIVPFSTLNYNKRYPNELLNWSEWYSPEFVVECFPGQFRNWFYSLLALSTMMRHGETTDPAEKRPFKTLLGHRLVMNEEGKPMHKSDGTAIWFEEAAEQLGVDTLRWLYLAQDPATDLRFGTRHKDDPVTLPTVDGPLSHTREGLPCCKVTSKPADEVRRQVLIPLWNSYAFFVNYARLDGFDPSRGPKVTDPAVFAKLGEMDRWILSNLQQLITQCRTGFEEFDTASVCKAIAAFIDDLSNWYIRRSRRRFWRSTKDDAATFSGEPKATATDNDKWEAYATLYEVLLTLSKLTAPAVPFLAERMYQNLAVGHRSSVIGEKERSPTASDREPTTDNRAPISVHLCAYPEPITALIDSALTARMATAERIVGLGLRLREIENLRVRQPLSKLQYVAGDEAAAHIELLTGVIAEELNVREIVRAEHLDELVSYKYKPNKKTLGPKYGKQLGAIDKHLATAETDAAVAKSLAPLRRGESVTIADLSVTLAPEDVLIATERAGDWATADEAGLQIALSTALTPELIHEGMARDFVRHIQQARKDANLEITDRIRVYYSGAAEVTAAVNAWKDYIARETLADAVEQTAEPPNRDAKAVAIGDADGAVWIAKV